MTDSLEWNSHFGKCLGHKDEVKVIRCKKCGFNHIVPLPEYNEDDNYYEKGFIADRPELIKRMEEDLKWWRIWHDFKFSIFDKILGREIKQKLLDIGSGLGYFLQSGEKAGWNVTGVEASKQSYEYAKKLGLNVINSFFDTKIKLPLGFYDVIHMNEVLEHLNSPIEVLNLAKKHLNPKGLLSITVPNEFNIFQETLVDNYGFKQWWIAPKVHTNYFNMYDLQKIMEDLNFKIVDAYSTYPLEWFILMGDDYIGDDNVGKKCHQKRKEFEIKMFEADKFDTLIDIYRDFAQRGIGRQLTIIGQKVE